MTFSTLRIAEVATPHKKKLSDIFLFHPKLVNPCDHIAKLEKVADNGQYI